MCAGEMVRPIVATLYSQCPERVVNAVIALVPSDRGSWWKPAARSRVVKTLAPRMASRIFSSRGGW